MLIWTDLLYTFASLNWSNISYWKRLISHFNVINQYPSCCYYRPSVQNFRVKLIRHLHQVCSKRIISALLPFGICLISQAIWINFEKQHVSVFEIWSRLIMFINKGPGPFIICKTLLLWICSRTILRSIQQTFYYGSVYFNFDPGAYWT